MVYLEHEDSNVVLCSILYFVLLFFEIMLLFANRSILMIHSNCWKAMGVVLGGPKTT